MGTLRSVSDPAVTGRKRNLVPCALFDDRITLQLCVLRKQELKAVFGNSCDVCIRGRDSVKGTLLKKGRLKTLRKVRKDIMPGELNGDGGFSGERAAGEKFSDAGS